MPYTTWLSQTNRQGGVHTTANVTIPAAVDSLNVHLLVDPAVFNTSAKSLQIVIEAFIDGEWKFQASVNWIGQDPPPNHRGRIGWYQMVGGFDQLVGKLAHVIITQNGNFRWGLEGEIV